ncbi:hypothetical protein BDW22DRAFT_610632 [Trametopsis cervina]|nr:hypothetical protein BDW22DRAFT_610632 [Trametopsis cervina]
MQTEEPVALGAALNEPGSSATPPGVTTPEAATDRGLITPPLSEIIEPSVSANIPNPISDSGVNVAFPTESTIPSTADSSSGPAESPPAHITDSTPDTVTVWPSAERHVRLSTETSVEVMIPREQEQYAEELHAKEAGSSKPDTLEQVHNSTIQTAPAADPPRSVDNTLVGRVSSLYQGVSSMVPSYSGLRELIFPTHSSTAVPTQSSSSSLVGYAFHGVIKPVILFTADWALLVLCYILIKMLRFRPDSVKTAMSMLP